jgi:hypothetical protein
VKAPVRCEWFGSPTADSTSFQPSAAFGFMCPLLQPRVDVPSPHRTGAGSGAAPHGGRRPVRA